jgi:hypothetical protein
MPQRRCMWETPSWLLSYKFQLFSLIEVRVEYVFLFFFGLLSLCNMLYVLAGEGVGAANSRLPREVHTLAITIKENNWNLYDNNQDGVSHIQRRCGIKRTHPQFVHMFHMVNYDTIHMNASLDNVYVRSFNATTPLYVGDAILVVIV